MIDRISVDKNVLHGKPCIKGARIPVYLVLDLLACKGRSGRTRNSRMMRLLLDENISQKTAFFFEEGCS